MEVSEVEFSLRYSKFWQDVRTSQEALMEIRQSFHGS